jgi:TRAP-type C4-dicarboxylate transport system permease small subunit
VLALQRTTDCQVAEKAEETYPSINVKKAVQTLEKLSIRVNQFLACLAGAAMVLMVIFIIVNIVLRAVYVPIPGINEIVGWLAAITTAFALGHTQIKRGHVDMDVLVEKFPPKIKHVVQFIMLLICMAFFCLISYQLCVYANEVMSNGTLSETLAVIFYPLIYLVAIGFIGLTLALLIDCIKLLQRGANQ